MGNAWRRIRSYNNKEVRILMIGLDAAGKTSTLYKLRLGEVVTTIPTIGFNVETVEYKNINFTALDVGGRGMIRPLMRHYYRNTDVIMFLLDSNDRDRISECKDELWRLLSEDELRSSHLLVMANKQDLPNAMSIEEVTEKMGLHNIRNREWYIQGTCAITGEGLYEGLSWLQSTLTQKEVKKAVVKPVKEVVNSVQPEDTPSKPEGKPNTSSWWAMLNSYFKTVAVS